MPIPSNYIKEATPSTIGNITIGSGLILDQYGVLSVSSGYGLATQDIPGIVMPGGGLWVNNEGRLIVSAGGGLDIDDEGSLFASVASVNNPGIVKVGAGLTIDAQGVLSSTGGGGYTLKAATVDILGGIKVGDGLAIDGYGKLSVNAGTGLSIDGYGKLNATGGGGSGGQTGGGGSGGQTGVAVDTQVFSFEGVVTPTIGLARWYPYAICNLTQFYASIEYSPLSSVTLQLKKNGVAIGDPIIIDAGEFKSNVIPFNQALQPSDYLTVDVVSGSSGSNIFATVVSNYTQLEVSNVPIASETTAGVIKVGSGLGMDAQGSLNVNSDIISRVVFNTFLKGLVSTYSGLVNVYVVSSTENLRGFFVAKMLTPSTTNVEFLVKVNSVDYASIIVVAGESSISGALPTRPLTIGDTIELYAPISNDASLANLVISIS